MEYGYIQLRLRHIESSHKGKENFTFLQSLSFHFFCFYIEYVLSYFLAFEESKLRNCY